MNENLIKYAAELNKVSNEISVEIKPVEDWLKKLNIGTQTWIKVTPDANLYFGYSRVEGKWGLAIKLEDEIWAFNSAPRYLRIKCINSLPQLFDAMVGSIKIQIEKVTEAVNAIKTFSKEKLQ